MENTNVDDRHHIATLVSESAEQLACPVLWAELDLDTINCLAGVGNGVHKH
jgi:hypothetical protein